MYREEKLVKNTMILSLGTFLPKIASFIVLPILTAVLTREEYGTYDLLTVLVSLILPTMTLQIQTAAFRFLLDSKDSIDDKKRIITNIVLFFLPISGISLVFIYVFLPYSNPIKFLICLYFALDGFVDCARQIVRGLSDNMAYAISSVITAFGRMIFVVLCVWYFRWGLLGTILSVCIANACSLLYLIYRDSLYQYLDIRLLEKETLKELLRYSWPMVPNCFSMWVMRVSDRFVVTACMGVSANAIYAAANKIPQLLTLAQSTFTMAWQENASLYSKEDDAPLYYSAMFAAMYDLLAGSVGLLLAITPVLFPILIRGNYREAYHQIPILLLGMFFFGMSAFLGGIYVAYKATKSIGVTTMAAAVCNFVLDIAFIHSIGLYAASGSTLISYIFLFLFRMFHVTKYVKITYHYPRLVFVLFLMLSECLLCYRQGIFFTSLRFLFGILIFILFNHSLLRLGGKKLKKIGEYIAERF